MVGLAKTLMSAWRATLAGEGQTNIVSTPEEGKILLPNSVMSNKIMCSCTATSASLLAVRRATKGRLGMRGDAGGELHDAGIAFLLTKLLIRK